MELKLAVNCSILFTELPLLDRPKAAQEAGFDAVEFWWPFPTATPSSHEVSAFVDAVGSSGTQLVGLNFFAGDMPAGERGIVSHPDRKDEFRASVVTASEIGEALGCKAFNALYGLTLDDSSSGNQQAAALDNLEFAAETVGEIGGTVLLEPVSGAERYPLKTAADVTAIIRELRESRDIYNVKFLYDLYHLAVNGARDLEQIVADNHELIGHVQVADAPARHQPGTGQLDIVSALRELDRHDYDGYVALEYVPQGTTVESFAWVPAFREALREQG